MQEPSSPPLKIDIHTPRRGHISLEVRNIPSHKPAAALIIFLHEGLGSLSHWRGWPDTLCRLAGARGLVFSRYGYGGSTPKPADELWGPDYLLEQARDDLPTLLQALGLGHEKPWIVGHSDGGTIALHYAALFPEKVRGTAVVAPHVFMEPKIRTAVAAARENYISSGLRDALSRHHTDPDSAFGGWNDAWSSPPFSNWDIRNDLATISCPVLAIQGDRDEYASLEQIYDIARAVPQTECLVLDDCGHSPHREQPQALNAGILEWMARV